jgi:hypothetical protein
MDEHEVAALVRQVATLEAKYAREARLAGLDSIPRKQRHILEHLHSLVVRLRRPDGPETAEGRKG